MHPLLTPDSRPFVGYGKAHIVWTTATIDVDFAARRCKTDRIKQQVRHNFSNPNRIAQKLRAFRMRPLARFYRQPYPALRGVPLHRSDVTGNQSADVDRHDMRAESNGDVAR